jgi:hypothetical protein
VKGRSGNPGGRPKVVAEVRDLARAQTAQAIATLSAIMSSAKAPAAARVAAANSLLDRGWGRPTQAMDVRATGPTLADLVKASYELPNQPIPAAVPKESQSK